MKRENREKTRAPCGSLQSTQNLHCSVFCEKSLYAEWYQDVLCHIFDQPLYIKAVDIIAASWEISSHPWWFASSCVLLGCSRIHHGWQWIGNYVGKCLSVPITDTHDAQACLF